MKSTMEKRNCTKWNDLNMVDITIDLVYGTATYLHVHPRGKEVSGLSSTRHRTAP